MKKEKQEQLFIEELNAPSIKTIDSETMQKIGSISSVASIFQAENESLSNRPVFEEGVKIEPSHINISALL